MHAEEMLVSLNDVYIPMDGRDRSVGMRTNDGYFSVVSFMSISEGSLHSSLVAWLWPIKVPPECCGFWMASILDKILTIDNLRWRKMIMVSGCLMFLAYVESTNYLLLYCLNVAAFWFLFWGGLDVAGSFLARWLFEAWSVAKGRVM